MNQFNTSIKGLRHIVMWRLKDEAEGRPKAGPANGALKPIAWPFKFMVATAIHVTFPSSNTGATTA